MAFSLDVWYWLGAILLILAGIAGTVLPALPGPPLVFGGLLLAAWIDGFQKVGAATLVVLGALTVAAAVVDFVAGAYGAKRVGASRSALIGASVGTVVGIFFGVPGLVFGPFAGALAGELLARGSVVRAGRVAVGTWIGLALAIAIKLALVGAMIGLFAIVYLL
jgi:uncharacterized protein YqgC (DUF456 family)